MNKKVYMAIVSALILAGSSLQACGQINSKQIKYSEVSVEARKEIAKYFLGEQIKAVTMDTDDMVTEYDIHFADGVKIEIDANGNWESIKCRTGIPNLAMLPEAAQKYIANNYPQAKAVKIEIDRKGYEVELNNNVELEFDLAGNFLRVDR